MTLDDPHDLERFLAAQAPIYEEIIRELKAGRKRTHWMWFIFPQFDGLGHSSTAKHFAIKSLAEAFAYIDHPVLGRRLLECSRLVGAVEGRSVSDIFGFPDNMKFRSSMTLFAQAGKERDVFEGLIAKYFAGEPDQATLDIIRRLGPGES